MKAFIKKFGIYLILFLLSFSYLESSVSSFYVLADDNDKDKDKEGNSDGDSIKGDPYKLINNADRELAYSIIVNYMNQLKVMYDLSDESIKKMDAVFYQMTVYVANNSITIGELNNLISTTKTNIKEVIGETSTTPKTESFIFMSNDIGIATGSYGSPCTVTIGLINLGDDVLTDIVVTPVQDIDPAKWPFVINTASDAKIINSLYPSNSVEEGALKKQLLTWTFNISDKALNGTYSIPFKVQYYRNGVMKEATITTYAVIKAKYGNGDLVKQDSSENENLSTPRIIVTGFRTVPETVYAGDTFTLSIDVQNTSSLTSVSNIQFDIKAATSGTQGNETVDAFLPTSGSSSIYVDRIAPKASTTLTIEMTARNDLTQKPYVVTLKSKYEGVKNQSYDAQSDISIPINQESIIDFSDGELSSSYIGVGENLNVIFDIYNKGKTTLNNVTISFKDGYVSGGTAFLGKIDPGSTGNVDVDVIGEMSNLDTGFITCTISYEDQAGNIVDVEKQFNVTIDEVMVDYQEDYYEYEDIDNSQEDKVISPVIIWVIAAIAVIVVIFIIIICVKKTKDKKRKLLEELNDNDDGTLL